MMSIYFQNGAWGVIPLIKWIQEQYNDPDIIMTENGVGVINEDTLQDDNRIFIVQVCFVMVCKSYYYLMLQRNKKFA